VCAFTPGATVAQDEPLDRIRAALDRADFDAAVAMLEPLAANGNPIAIRLLDLLRAQTPKDRVDWLMTRIQAAVEAQDLDETERLVRLMPDEESAQREQLLEVIARTRGAVATADREIAEFQVESAVTAGCLTNMTRNDDGTVLTSGGCPAHADGALQIRHAAEVAAAKDRLVRTGGEFSTVTTSSGGNREIDFRRPDER
jgi:hypothetical protein